MSIEIPTRGFDCTIALPIHSREVVVTMCILFQGLIPSVSEQKATGHMALNKDVYITLMVDLQEEDKVTIRSGFVLVFFIQYAMHRYVLQIAWIDMFNKETRVAALLILRPKGKPGR